MDNYCFICNYNDNNHFYITCNHSFKYYQYDMYLIPYQILIKYFSNIKKFTLKKYFKK